MRGKIGLDDRMARYKEGIVMKQSEKFNRGFAYVLALLLLAIFSTLAVAFASTTDLGLRKSENYRRADKARLAAEGGLEFVVYLLKDLETQGWTGQPDMLPVVYSHLAGQLDGTLNLSGGSISLFEESISVPSISVDSGDASFSFAVTCPDDSTFRVIVTGESGSCSRRLAINYNVTEDTSILNYSVASRSRVIITDAAVVDGDICSTWDRTYISGHYIPPFSTDEDTAVNGELATVMSQSGFDEYNSGSFIEGEHEGLVYDAPNLEGYTTEDFDTSSYQAGTTNITTLDPPNHWDNDDPFPALSNIRRRIDRPVYENQTFDNVYIPVGYNPKFVNCTFNQIIYIDTNEAATLDEWSHGYYNEHAIPGEEHQSNDEHNDHSNNVIFDDCTFNGPVITAVPRDYWWSKNALTFTGETTFTNDYMPESTIMAPNFGVDIGGRGYDIEGNPDSTLTGIIVGGIVDIRGRANIEGTILSMYYPDTDRGSAARYYGTNIGCDDDGGETGGATGFPGDIRIVPRPEFELPFGIRKKYTVRAVAGSYEELTP